MLRPSWFVLVAPILLMFADGDRAYAGLVPIPQTSFPSGSTAVSVSSLALGTEVNGLSIGGLTFGVSVNNVSTNNLMSVTFGPGVTNHLTTPAIVSALNPSGMALTVNFSKDESYFGYGFALLEFGQVNVGTTIQLFENSTSLGTLSYGAVPDPTFSGGFAGVFSTTSFNRAVMTFDPNAGAVAVNNFLYASTVPEPASAGLVLMGSASVLATLFLRHRRTSPGR